MRWAIKLPLFSVAIFISCDSNESNKCSFKDAAETQKSKDMGFGMDMEDRLSEIGNKCLIPEILEGLRIVQNWNLELDRKLCVNEDFNLNTYQRGYSSKSSEDLVRIWLGGKIGVDRDIDPRTFIVQWIRFEYQDNYRTFESDGMQWVIVEDVSLEND